MKAQFGISFLFALFSLSLSVIPPQSHAQSSKPSSSPELVVYTYDSWLSKNGIGPAILPLFEKACACRVKALGSGDGAQILGRLQLDAKRGKPTAHVVVGIDQNLWPKVKAHVEDWGSWRPKGFEEVRKEVQVIDPAQGFLPFDYSVFAFMSDQEELAKRGLSAPKSLKDLLDPKWRKGFILEDPRTSTPGLAFVMFVKATMGEEAWPMFGKLGNQWLTLTPSWDNAYGLFLKGEAPLVWSYLTSQAYHREKGDRKGRYRAIELEEGGPIQVEGAALVKGSIRDEETRKRARQFLEFLISREAQEKIPLKNWMLPVVSSVKLPQSFQNLPMPKKVLNPADGAQDLSGLLHQWSQALRKGR